MSQESDNSSQFKLVYLLNPVYLYKRARSIESFGDLVKISGNLFILFLLMSLFSNAQNIVLFGENYGRQPLNKHYKFNFEASNNVIEKGRVYNLSLEITNVHKKNIKTTKISLELPTGIICESSNLVSEIKNIAPLASSKVNYTLRIPENYQVSNSEIVLKFKIQNKSSKIGYGIIGVAFIIVGNAVGIPLTYNNFGNMEGSEIKESIALTSISTGSSVGVSSLIYSLWPRISNKIQLTIPLLNKSNNNPIIPDVPLFTKESKTENKKNILESNSSSDVDINIPANTLVKTNTYALIIGNEDYSSFQTGLNTEVNVDYALNDAKMFKEYCNKTLGIPNKQIKIFTNATYGQMNQGIAWLNNLSKVDNGNAELFFYYSGHGLPDEQTKESYLMPVDISGSNVTQAIKLSDVYNKLNEYPAKKVMVFLDACFSGGARNQGLIAMKGVKIKPKDNMVTGNMIVFSSSTGEESSGVYREKQHGYMTYFLLKKLQESKGNISYKELADFIIENVKKETALNGKTQTPQLKYSPNIEKSWTNWKIK